MRLRVLFGAFAGVATLAAANIGWTVHAPPAGAAGCFDWTRALTQGDSGDDVAQLQIRVAGCAQPGDPVDVDGQFGPETAAAVSAFQGGYGLGSDGVAGPPTFAKIHELEGADCAPAHFSYPEFASCEGGFGGGTSLKPAWSRTSSV